MFLDTPVRAVFEEEVSYYFGGGFNFLIGKMEGFAEEVEGEGVGVGSGASEAGRGCWMGGYGFVVHAVIVLQRVAGVWAQMSWK